MTRRLEVCESPAEAAGRACELIAEASPSTIALSGGSSPLPLYRLLQERGMLSGASIWMVDERCVPPDHEASNTRLLQEFFGDRVHRMRGEEPPHVAAGAYEEAIVALLGPEPVFDLMVLGMGNDGHTASLFPGSTELDERERIVIATDQPHAGFHRVTLTLPVLNRARSVLFFVTGESKAPAFAKIQDGELLPAGRVLGATWVIDRPVLSVPIATPRRRRWDPIEGQESLFELDG